MMNKFSFLRPAINKIHRALNMLREKIAGLDFTKGVSLQELGLTEEQGNIYAASPSQDLHEVLRSLEIEKGDAILDLGCGKGAAMYEMSKFPFSKIAGVEINQVMCSIARRNFKRLKLKQLEVFQSDAGAFKQVDQFNYFYLYNPFPEQVVLKVLENIQASYERLPRKMVLIYYLPAQQKLIEEHGFFNYSHSFKGTKYDTSFFVRQSIN